MRASLYACVNRKSPPCVRQRGGSSRRVLRERGEQAQALRHASQLAVLLPFGVEQQLLYGGGHGVPGRDRRVVNADLRGESD